MLNFFYINKEYLIKNIILFLLIYCSFESLLFGTNILISFKVYMISIYLVLEFIMLMMIVFKEKKLTFDKKDIFKCYILISLIFFAQIYSYIRGYSFFCPQYFYNVLIIIIALTFGKIYSQDDFKKIFVNIMYYLAVFGIIIYCLNILRIDIPHFIVINKSNGIFYHYLLSATVLPNKYSILRLFGIFREPGVFAIFLSMALFFELFFSQKIALRKLIVFIIAILLTFSTSGYIIMSLYLLIYFFSFTDYSKKSLFLKVLLILFAISIFMFGISSEYNNFVFGKLYIENDSYNSRIYSLYSGFVLSFKNFFLGQGWDYIITEFSNFVDNNYQIMNVHFTNTYLKMAVTYGWIFTLIILFYTFIFLKKKSFSKKQFILFIIIWLMMFSNEDFILNPIIYLILFVRNKSYENS